MGDLVQLIGNQAVQYRRNPAVVPTVRNIVHPISQLRYTLSIAEVDVRQGFLTLSLSNSAL